MHERPLPTDEPCDPCNQAARQLAQASDSFDAGQMPVCAVQVAAALAFAQARGLHAATGPLHLLGARRAIAALAHDEAATHVGAALALARELVDESLQSHAHIVSARLNIALGDLGTATAELERASATALAHEDSRLGFEFLDTLVATQASLAQIDAALLTLDRLDRVATRLGLPRLRSQALGNRAGRLFSKGYEQLKAGHAEEGRATLEQSVALGRQAADEAEAAGAQRQTLSVLNNLAGALACLERNDEALATFARHRALAQALGHETTLVNAMLGEARLRRNLGQTMQARALATQAIGLGERLHADRITALLYEMLSEMDEHEGRHAAALAHYKQFHERLKREERMAASMHTRVLAVRLETERAQREAVAERERAETLRRTNRALELRTEVLSREALQDALTGLANRRRIDAHLAGDHAASRAQGRPACVALLDVDHFKHINDRHSHAVGDLVLVQLAALISRQCREGDLAARYGGEEFLISFGSIELVRAVAACERLRAAVQGHDWPAIAPGLAVTVSLGVVDLATHAGVAEGLAAADRLMYEAKNAGRNRVRGAAPPQAR